MLSSSAGLKATKTEAKYSAIFNQFIQLSNSLQQKANASQDNEVNQILSNHARVVEHFIEDISSLRISLEDKVDELERRIEHYENVVESLVFHEFKKLSFKIKLAFIKALQLNVSEQDLNLYEKKDTKIIESVNKLIKNSLLSGLDKKSINNYAKQIKPSLPNRKDYNFSKDEYGFSKNYLGELNPALINPTPTKIPYEQIIQRLESLCGTPDSANQYIFVDKATGKLTNYLGNQSTKEPLIPFDEIVKNTELFGGFPYRDYNVFHDEKTNTYTNYLGEPSEPPHIKCYRSAFSFDNNKKNQVTKLVEVAKFLRISIEQNFIKNFSGNSNDDSKAIKLIASNLISELDKIIKAGNKKHFNSSDIEKIISTSHKYQILVTHAIETLNVTEETMLKLLDVMFKSYNLPEDSKNFFREMHDNKNITALNNQMLDCLTMNLGELSSKLAKTEVKLAPIEKKRLNIESQSETTSSKISDYNTQAKRNESINQRLRIERPTLIAGH